MTIAVLSIVPSALSLQWREVWILPFLLLGTIVSWVLHIRGLFSERERIWFYAVVAWGACMFDGAHATSLFDFSVSIAMIMVLFSQTDERKIIYGTLAVYLLLLLFQVIAILRGESVEPSSLIVSQILMHAACVLIICRVCINIINKREADRRSDERVIRELTFTRKRTENFMANVSHELRTPVNVVTGISGIMETRLQDTQDREDAAHILEAGRRLSDQVDDILDFTEIETGRLTITKEPYMISSVVGDMISALGIGTGEFDAQIIIDVDADIPKKLIGDARRIKKILTHLTANAIKFTKQGAVYINVYRMEETYGVNLCIDVRDTGIGMSREALELVREGIYQEDAERNRENTGFGLGLRIVFGLAHAMNGFVRIDSEKGEGTRVHVSIPQEVADQERCMEVREPHRLKLAFFQRAEKYANPAVGAFYMKMIGHVIDAFGLTLQHVTTLGELKKMVEEYPFTHVFVPDEEYSEDPQYFDALGEKTHVVVVARYGFRPTPFSRVTILRKPLYAFPLIAVLNAENEQEAKEVLYDEEEARFDGLKVLVVDDEEMNLIVARGLFTEYGMEVETAGSGQESIDMIRQRPYDVVFMDHMMPVMDGVEAAHRIRDMLAASGRRTLIVALTANAVSGAREMFAAEGFDGFVAKPIERMELERTLKRILPGMGGGKSRQDAWAQADDTL